MTIGEPIIEQLHAGRLPLSFVTNSKAFVRQVENDMAAARLSPVFRAYYALRGMIPLALRQALQRNRNRRIEVRPNWFIPQSFMSKLADDLASESGTAIIHPWPDDAQFAFVLTHDVETADGLKGIAAIAEIEEALGFRSSWSLVPAGYKIDKGLVKDLVDRGFEIAIHGYNHDGKLLTSKTTFDKRSIAINSAISDLSASGFRAPMVHRNLEWFQQLNVDYDASCFDIDPYQAMPGGVGSIWPFMAGKLVELPYTMPQDHTLTVTLKQSTNATWQVKLNYLREHSGMAMMLTHPDYMTKADAKSEYRDFLKYVKDGGGYWHALPREVAHWWREREASELDMNRITGPASDRGSIRSIQVDQQGLRFASIH